MAERNPAKPVSASPAGEHAATVLLVDDQAMIGDIIRRSLAKQPNLNFSHCTDPREAVGFAERIRPTVILQDLRLPGMSGLTLLRKYRASPPLRTVPVIILSIEEKPTVKSEAFALGADDYIVKPPNPIELIARIRHHSSTYLSQVQRDQAYRALRERQKQLLVTAAELQRQNGVDGLTGLHNRRYLDEYLTIEWKRAVREQTPLSVLMIDVDEFKRYNDTYGHPAGDEALRHVAAVIRRSFERPADAAARYGGEEFMVVLPNTLSGGARHVADKIVRHVENLQIEHTASGAAPCLTVSIGVASTVPSRDGQLTTLIQMADAALYEAKRMGRNRAAAYFREESSTNAHEASPKSRRP
jgi:two-component system, chemotaxis family, response regulator WspR